MLKKLKSFFILTILTTLISCEYQLSEMNFIDIEMPPENKFIDLNFIPESDTIFIFNNTEIEYFSEDKADLLNIEVSIGDKELSVNSGNNILINPENFDIGFHTMVAKFYFSTSSGSLADKLGAEVYVKEKKWQVLIDGSKAPSIKADYIITKEGYLKIIWEKCDQYNFYAYEIDKTYTTIKVIEDSEVTSFVDSCYVGGNQEYYVNIRVKSKNAITRGEKLQVNIRVPTLQFENTGLDTLRIFWASSPLDVKFRLVDFNGYKTLFETSTDTSFKMQCPAIGVYKTLQLYTQPKSNNCNYESKMDQSNFHIGTRIESNWPEYGYNKLDKTFYSNTYKEIKAYHISSKQLLNTLSLSQRPYAYACPLNSTAIATLSSSQINIFDNNNLQNPTTIAISSFFYLPTHFLMSDNGYIAYAYKNVYNLIDIAKKETLISYTMCDEPIFSSIGTPHVTTSQDASYACFATSNGLKLCGITNGQLVELLNDSRSYQSAYFNPLDPTMIFLTLENDSSIEIRNIPDFSLIKKIQLPSSASIANLDIESGFLLLNDQTYLYVLDIQTSIIKIRLSAGKYKTQLMGNVLFTKGGYFLDIYNYLN